jgi:hypothetical protein
MNSLAKTPHPALSGTPLKRGPKSSLPEIPSREGWRPAPGCGCATRILEMCNVIYYRLSALP